MREFPEEKAKVIEEYERFSQLFIEDKLEFESEAKKAIDSIISQAENEERKNNLRKLQAQWNQALR